MLSNGVIHCSKYLIFPQDRRERAPEAAILTGSSSNYTERAGMVWETRGLPSRFIWIELQNRCQWRWGLDSDDLTENQPQPSARLKTLTSTLIIPDITKISSNNCLLLHNFKILLPYIAASYLPTLLLITSRSNDCNNETVSLQNLWAGNIAKSMTLEGNSAPLPANVDQRPPLQRGLMKPASRFPAI